MSDLETPAEPVAPEPVIAEPAPVVAEPLDEDAALDQQIEEQAIDLPEGEKLVPLSALTSVREKYKQSKAEAARAKDLDAELTRLRAEADENRPWLEAAKTIAATRQLQPQQQAAPEVDAALTSELTELARDLDLYKADGTADLDKAKRIYDRTEQTAQRAAQRAVAPVQQHTVQQQSSVMFNRAMLTAGEGGAKPDPAILKEVWTKLDPRLTATEDGAREAWVAAVGRSVALGKIQWPEGTGPAPKVKEPLPAPLLTERAGGRETNESPINDKERQAAKAMGITEKEYLETAAKRPWRR